MGLVEEDHDVDSVRPLGRDRADTTAGDPSGVCASGRAVSSTNRARLVRRPAMEEA